MHVLFCHISLFLSFFVTFRIFMFSLSPFHILPFLFFFFYTFLFVRFLSELFILTRLSMMFFFSSVKTFVLCPLILMLSFSVLFRLSSLSQSDHQSVWHDQTKEAGNIWQYKAGHQNSIKYSCLFTYRDAACAFCSSECVTNTQNV